MCSSKPKTPSPPPVLPEAPTMPDTEASQGDPDKRRRAAASGQGRTSTILTGPRGTTESAATSAKTLLGA